MNKVNWIIDKYIFEDYEDKLISAIKNNDSNVFLFDDVKYEGIEQYIKNKFTDQDIVIFHGSLQHGRRINNTKLYTVKYGKICLDCHPYKKMLQRKEKLNKINQSI